MRRLLNDEQRRQYRRFRAAGYGPVQALSYARTVALWHKLERAGIVQLDLANDQDFDPADLDEQDRDAYERDGAFGVVGSIRLDEEDAWWPVSSVWGVVGWSDPLNVYDSPCAADVMQDTIAALRAAMRQRCPCCRQLREFVRLVVA